MILASESCCGRQRVSLRIVIHSKGYHRTLISVNKAGLNFATALHLSPNFNILLLKAHTYVCDIHLIVSKFKAIL